MSFQISTEKGGKKELSKGLCSLEVLSLPSRRFLRGGGGGRIEKQNASSFSNCFILTGINYRFALTDVSGHYSTLHVVIGS